jgi:hypothetical protein
MRMTRSVLVAWFVLVACAKSNAPSVEAWSVSDYAAAGLRIDQVWTPDDYTTAAKVLSDATAEHRDRLPRFGGDKSGAVFAKLIADLPDDPSRPIQERFGAHFTHFEALNAISKLYMPDQLATPPRELIELQGALLRAAVVEMRQAGPFLASFGPDDPKHAARLEGLARMNDGLGTMLLGGVVMADEKRIPDDDRVALLRHITVALPVLFPRARAGTQQQIRDQLAKEAAGFPAGALRDAAVAAQQAIPK